MYRQLVLLLLIIVFIVINSINLHIDTFDVDKYINVEVRGAVQKEDIYKLPLGSTYSDLFKIINLDNNACTDIYSLQDVLYNNQIIVIPYKNNTNNDNKLISINSSTIDQLKTIPGIGDSIANRIVEYRLKYGSYISLEDIKNVSGIGDKKFEIIKKYITL